MQLFRSNDITMLCIGEIATSDLTPLAIGRPSGTSIESALPIINPSGSRQAILTMLPMDHPTVSNLPSKYNQMTREEIGYMGGNPKQSMTN